MADNQSYSKNNMHYFNCQPYPYQEQNLNRNNVCQQIQCSELLMIQMNKPPLLNPKLSPISNQNPGFQKTKKIRKYKTEHTLLANTTNLRDKADKNHQCYSVNLIKKRSNNTRKSSISILTSTQATPDTISQSASKKRLKGFGFQDLQIQIENQETLQQNQTQQNNNQILQYFPEIINYCLSIESQPATLQKLRMVQKQNGFDNRIQLFNLIKSVHVKLGLSVETHNLAKELVDSLLVRFKIAVQYHLFFVTACLSISWKYHQVKVFCLDQLCISIGLGKQKHQVKQIQSKILVHLNWKINILSSIDFVGFILEENSEVKAIASIIIQTALRNFQIRQFKQSIVALASVQIAREELNLISRNYFNRSDTLQCKQFILNVINDPIHKNNQGMLQRKSLYLSHFSSFEE